LGITPTRSRRRMKHLKHETSTKHQCAATIPLEMTGCESRPSAAHTGLVKGRIDGKIDRPHRPHSASLGICNRGLTPQISRRPSGPMRCRKHFSSTHAGPLRGRVHAQMEVAHAGVLQGTTCRCDESDPIEVISVCRELHDHNPVSLRASRAVHRAVVSAD
jgi:hypothetical protein